METSTYLSLVIVWTINWQYQKVTKQKVTLCLCIAILYSTHLLLVPLTITFVGLRDLVDFLPASLATIISYFSAEITRGIWKPVPMNGIDWPSPSPTLLSTESEIKEILASAGVHIKSCYPRMCFVLCSVVMHLLGHKNISFLVLLLLLDSLFCFLYFGRATFIQKLTSVQTELGYLTNSFFFCAFRS